MTSECEKSKKKKKKAFIAREIHENKKRDLLDFCNIKSLSI